MPQLLHAESEYGRRLVAFFDVPYPDLPFMAAKVTYLRRHYPLGVEIHKDSFEITCQLKGKQVYEVSGREYEVSAGQVFVTLPNEPHSSGSAPFDKSELYHLIANFDAFPPGFLGATPEEGRLLLARCHRVFNENRIIPFGVHGIALFARLLPLYETESPIKRTLIRNLLSEMLLFLLQNAENPRENGAPELSGVLSYIQANLESDISIEKLAHMAGISKSRFHVVFKEEMGVPPREYITREKVQAAKILLRETGRSVTDIAYQLNFSSAQYFSLVFKQYTNTTPKLYRDTKL